MEETWQRHEIKILDQELTFDSYLKFSNEGLETNAENLHQKFVNSQQHLNDVRKFHMEIMSEPLTNIQQELDRMKIPLIAPDVNKSSSYFVRDGEGISYALGAIKNVGIEAIKELEEERNKNGNFKNFNDFLARVSPSVSNKKTLEALP